MESMSIRQRWKRAMSEDRPVSSRDADSASAELLVSVRDLQEAQVAVCAGAGILDFKEPSRGALAACDPSIWMAAANELTARSLESCSFQLSAALGESVTAYELAPLVPSEFSFAKVGPSGCSTAQKLTSLWESMRLPRSVELVPVAYADHIAAGVMAPEQVLDLVIESGRRRLLIDTFVKDGRTLTDHLPIDRLKSLVSAARKHQVWLALAGSLRLKEMRSLVSGGVLPDCWGVRGDVCDQRDRTGRIDPQRVTAWHRATCSPAA